GVLGEQFAVHDRHARRRRTVLEPEPLLVLIVDAQTRLDSRVVAVAGVGSAGDRVPLASADVLVVRRIGETDGRVDAGALLVNVLERGLDTRLLRIVIEGVEDGHVMREAIWRVRRIDPFT